MITIHETKECEEEATILEEELGKAPKTLSNGKSPGYEGIPIKLFKEVDEEAVKVLTCQQIWIKRIWPKQWKESVYVPIQKRRCQNMLKQSDNSPAIACLQSYAESHSVQIGYIHEARNGNRTGRFHERKRYTRSMYMCFIDYSKAFDCVDHPTLWNMMEDMGIPKHNGTGN